MKSWPSQREWLSPPPPSSRAWPMSFPDGVETEGLLYGPPRPGRVDLVLLPRVVVRARRSQGGHVLPPPKYNVFNINDTGVVVYEQSTLDFMSRSDAAKVGLLSNRAIVLGD